MTQSNACRVHVPAGRAVVARGAALQELVALGRRHVRIFGDGLAQRQRSGAQDARRKRCAAQQPAPPRHGASGSRRSLARVKRYWRGARCSDGDVAVELTWRGSVSFHAFHARARKLSVASQSAAEMPASPAEWPASAMTRSCASGHARCRSQAERMGHTTS